MSGGVLESLRAIDAFPKHSDEYRLRTTHGAVSSVVAVVAMLYLLGSELAFYSRVHTVDRLIVNSSHAEHLTVKFDLELPHISCDLVSVDAMDQSNQQQEGVRHKVMKTKVNRGSGEQGATKREQALGTLQHEHQLAETAGDDGAKASEKSPGCGLCYGAEEDPDECCNTCEDVRLAYKRKGWAFDPATVMQCKAERVRLQVAASEDSGCHLFGELELTTLAGNFHFAPGAHMQEATQLGHFTVNELLSFTFRSFNVSHRVNSLSFGNHFPGIKSPLDAAERTVSDGHGMYQYYIKVVPTVYRYLDGREVVSNQYSVTEHLRHINPGSGRGLPGVWFFYEVSPVHAVFEETKRSFLEFVASVCAILGGVFTVVGVVDSGVDMALGKLGKQTGPLLR